MRFVLVVLMCLLSISLLAGDVKLAWDAVSSPNVTGYRIHYGTQSGVYTTMVTLGNVTQTTITGLSADKGKMYYFACTSADAAGNQSDYSNEVQTYAPHTTINPVAAPQITGVTK